MMFICLLWINYAQISYWVKNFLKQYKSVEITSGGSEPTLHVCALKAMNVPPPSLFRNLTPDCKPVAVKSGRYTADDSKFIETETKNS